MTTRVRVREIADHYGIKRYELGRRAGLSNPTMDDFWLRPETVNPRLRTLERVAEAIMEIIHEQSLDTNVVVTILDLLEVRP